MYPSFALHLSVLSKIGGIPNRQLISYINNNFTKKVGLIIFFVLFEFFLVLFNKMVLYDSSKKIFISDFLLLLFL